MGKVIKKKLNGMNWWMKTSLVLLLTLATSLFMYQGWYKPAPAAAATVTYGVTVPSTASTGIDGAAQMPTAAASIATAPTVRGNMSTTLTTSGASYRPTTGMTSGTPVTLLKLYSPAYASAQTITAPAGSFAIRGYNASDTWTFHVYSHNPAGVAGNKTLMYSSNTTTSGTTATVVVTPTYTLVNSAMPSGYKLLVEVVYTPGGTTYTPRIYLDGTTNTTWCQLTVTETAAATGGSLAVSTATQTVAEAVGNATVSVTRTGGSTGAASVSYLIADGTALAGQDYTSSPASGTLNWAAGDGTAKTITIPITNDTYDEGGENFSVTLSSPTGTGVTLGTATQTITITDDDTTPTIGFTAATSSGSNSTTPATFTVALSSVSGQITSVPYTFTNGTATNGTDYTGTPATLTIPALSASGVISVPISAASAGGTFTINLGTPVNAGNGTNMSHVYTITALPPTTITQCGGCHGHPAGPNALVDGATRNNPAGSFQGSHAQHVSVAADCAKCHTTPTGMDHSNSTVEMNATISGGTYSGGVTSVPVTNTATRTYGSCAATNCHGTGNPVWGATPTTQSTCTKCHGVNNTTPAAYTADTETAAPGYLTTGRDTGGATVAADVEVGAHDTHLRALNAISSAIACTECHSNVNTTNATFTGHMDGAGTLSFGTLATSGTGTAPGYNGTTRTCSSTYCHFGRSTAAPATTTANVVWNNTAYMTGTDTAAADCGKCHASPPETSSNHTALMTIADCNGCHNHVNTSGVFTNASLHVNGIVESQATCIGCHDKVQGTRSIVTTEFGVAFGHKKSGRTAVTDSDCIVCHLEGDFTTQKAVNAPTGKHKDGNIDLRDPDGAGETAITNNSGAAFTFTKYAISYAAGSRTTTLGNTIPEVITVKFCMKCHDANGAQNPTARTRNATNTATTGTANMPFEGVNIGANYTTTNGASAAGGVVDVATQFAAINSSRHPVGAPNSRAYPYSTRLVAPYNNIGTTRDANTQAAAGASPRVKANSVVMVCEDCHTTATTITTRTITAHGSAGTTNMRGTYFVASPTLCTTCHTGVYADATNGRHNTGSAFALGSTRANGAMLKCNFCHFSINDATYTAAKRPRWAQDVHGFNNMYNTTAGWPAGAASGVRPVAFMRSGAAGGGSWPAANSPRPYVVVANATTGQAALAAGQSTCGGTFAFTSGSSGVSCSSNGHTNYSPGGSY